MTHQEHDWMDEIVEKPVPEHEKRARDFSSFVNEQELYGVVTARLTCDSEEEYRRYAEEIKDKNPEGARISIEMANALRDISGSLSQVAVRYYGFSSEGSLQNAKDFIAQKASELQGTLYIRTDEEEQLGGVHGKEATIKRIKKPVGFTVC